MIQPPSPVSALPGSLQLKPLLLQLSPTAGALLPQVLTLLESHGRPLRWAITRTEAVAGGRSSLQIEAVVLTAASAQ